MTKGAIDGSHCCRYSECAPSSLFSSFFPAIVHQVQGMTCVPDRLLQQAGRLQTLNEISRAVSATLDLHTLYDTIYQQVGRVMDTTLFFIALLGADGRAIELPYSREDGDLILDQTGPRGNSVTRLVIESGEALLFNTDREYQRYAFEYGLRALSVGDMEQD